MWENIDSSIIAVKIFEDIGFIFIIIYGLVIGIMIWKGHPSGKQLAKQYLLIRLIVFIVVEIIAFVWMVSIDEMEPVYFGSFVGVFFREGGYFLLWWLYFKMSVRVRNTYDIEKPSIM